MGFETTVLQMSPSAQMSLMSVTNINEARVRGIGWCERFMICKKSFPNTLQMRLDLWPMLWIHESRAPQLHSHRGVGLKCQVLGSVLTRPNNHRMYYPVVNYMAWWWFGFMMTSPNGNISRITGPLWGESTGSHRSPMVSHIKGQWRGALVFLVFFYLLPNKGLSKQSIRRWCETTSHSLWLHCNVSGCNAIPFLTEQYARCQVIWRGDQTGWNEIHLYDVVPLQTNHWSTIR